MKWHLFYKTDLALVQLSLALHHLVLEIKPVTSNSQSNTNGIVIEVTRQVYYLSMQNKEHPVQYFTYNKAKYRLAIEFPKSKLYMQSNKYSSPINNIIIFDQTSACL